MVDHLLREGRSRNMAAIRAKDTKPELALRTALRMQKATGYRVHLKSLPGRPDLTFTRWRVAIFVDGAFWHGHPDHIRPSAADYWQAKIARTQERDRAANAALRADGWTVLRYWDFEIRQQLDEIVSEIMTALQASGWRPRSESVLEAY